MSEVRSGKDLVEQQILVAAGHQLGWRQDDIEFTGHAIECRINAENPEDGFRPSPGKIEKWVSPAGEGVRVDTHVQSGYVVPPHYDSLLCKVITHGATRDEACDRMINALGDLVCDGVHTTAAMHRQILASEDFRSNNYDTRAIPGFSQE